MTPNAAEPSFLDGVPVLRDFGRIADQASYVPLPGDWTIGLADVVKSTQAIEAGNYKAVNMAGAAVISAVSNALGGADFPFCFGGDGASFAVPPAFAPIAREALAATATLVGEEFGLELRIAALPVAAVREAGLDVTVARFAASENVAYAMFSGGGLAWAEARMKAGEFALDAAPPGSRPDLSGLSCRFEEMPSRRGIVLSLIVRPGPATDAGRYEALIGELLRSIEASPDKARPVPDIGPALAWPAPGFELEARVARRPGGSLTLSRLIVLARTAVSTLILRWGIPVGSFRPAAYIEQVVANTDYRKYDDGLRLTIDCSAALADAIEARLARAQADGDARYGLHRQSATLMTCFTPSVMRSDHIHFVDGASGGYAAAAMQLKD